jgi:hypothetical protein
MILTYDEYMLFESISNILEKKIIIEDDFEKAIKELQVSPGNPKRKKIIDSILELIQRDIESVVLDLDDDKAINDIKSIDLSKKPGFLEIIITKPNGKEVKQEIKIGKLIQVLLKNLRLKSDELEDFTNSLKIIQMGEDPSFKLVEGEDILYYYHPKNMVKAGELGNSCMSHDHTQKFLQFYAKNENVKLFLKTNEENKTIARALLWKTDKGLYLDRRYAIDNDLKLAILKEAQNRFKLYNFFKEKYDINFNAQVEVSFINENNAPKFKYPYMDTFEYLVIYKNKSILHSNREVAFLEKKNAFNIYMLGSTNGGFEDIEGYDDEGYDAEGYDADGYDREGYNMFGYDSDGYNRAGFDEEGYDEDGYDSDGYDRDGYNEDGYDMDGYDRDGYDWDGYDRDGYDREGYDADGYDREDFDRDGYDKDGYDEDGYDRDGYDKDGYDKDGNEKDS